MVELFLNILTLLGLNFFKFPDITKKKLRYEKKFIFKRDKYFFINFFEFQDLCMVICFIFEEFFIFIFVAIKTIYYYKKDDIILYDKYFIEKTHLLKKRIILFLYSFMLMLCIKNFSKSKKFFLFHKLFLNPFVELGYILFYFSFILITFYNLKEQFYFTRQNEEYENIQYSSSFVILNKEKYCKEDIILNRFIIYRYIQFFFISYILQNFFQNSLIVKILLFLTFFVFITYIAFRLIFKS